MVKEVILAQPRGFCAGVDRAIDIVTRALERFGAPIYVRHEIVHNQHVVDSLRKKGAVFVESLDAVPAGGTVIFSAHGVPLSVKEDAQARGLVIFDATCPLVTKVHMEVIKMRRMGCDIVMIGHRGHPEVEGTMGQLEGGMHLVETVEDVYTLPLLPTQKIAYVTQTTLSIDDTVDIIAALEKKFPDIIAPKKADICYATTNRQQAVKIMAKEADVVIVVGSQASSNATRLREVAEKKGILSYMIDHADQLDPKWFKEATRVGVTAGASTPEVLVQEVVEALKQWGHQHVRVLAGEEENVSFPLPKGL